ncbi:MAG: polysaccharide deacetylase family protein [Alphaproteobacteria bacterium]|nr:polysaccharide deacetylase family protein [Alphaproteobacteria bacterium]
MIDRRTLLTSAAALIALSKPAAAAIDDAPQLAVTIDDFDLANTKFAGGLARHGNIMITLDRFNIKAAAFPAGKNVDNVSGRAALEVWSNHGHTIGNHTYTHAYYTGEDPAATMADIRRAEKVYARQRTYTKLFRFPYLAEGKTPEARDAMRALLKKNGYRNGHVTIDTSDWYINQRMMKRLADTPNPDLDPYYRYYVAHLLERATYYDGLARRVLGRSPPHTLLLHHNLACSLFLGEALSAFRDKGWRLIDAATAFADPLYASEPNIAPAGQSLIWALAKESGKFETELRYPGENDTYEAPKMDALGL